MGVKKIIIFLDAPLNSQHDLLATFRLGVPLPQQDMSFQAK